MNLYNPKEDSVNKSLLLITFSFLAFNISCKKDPTSSQNTAPIASFTITPASGGTTATVFTFDASGCTDNNEDGTSVLEVRWDWNNDGTWDTDYSTTKTATHQYTTEGNKTINLEVKDTGGLTNTVTKSVSVSNGGGTGTVTDIDGNIYQTVQIGNQEWMAENLKVTHYRNGNAIPNVTDNTEWSNLATGAYCSYDNNDSNVSIYGRLYNWFTVVDSRGIAPAGWHVPTDGEWDTLVNYLGGSSTAGGKLKEIGTAHWAIPNEGATNESGFTAVPGGYRYLDGTFSSMDFHALFWSTTGLHSSYAWARTLYDSHSDVTRNYYNRRTGFSVRCIRD